MAACSSARNLSEMVAEDGTRLAFIGNDGTSQRLYITDSRGLELSAVTADNCQVQGPPAWSPDGLSIAITVVVHRRASGLRRITKRVFRSEALGVIDDLAFRLQLANALTRETRPLYPDGAITVAIQPEFSPCGKRILFMGSEGAVGYPSLGGLKLFTLELADARITEVLSDAWFVASAAWSPCGERIVIAGNPNGKSTAPYGGVWVLNRDGSNPQSRTRGYLGNVGLRVHHDMPTWNTSQNNVLVVPDASYAYATVVKRGCAEITKIALSGPIVCEAVVSGPRTCVVMDANARTSQLIYAVSDLNTPWELNLSNIDGKKEKRLTHLNAKILEGWPTLKAEHLEFQSADGMPLEAWHLSRTDRIGPQPTVMFIHGGPMLAVGHCFRFDFHLLAANGYGVVFSNYRGSVGYGEAFMSGLMDDFGSRGYPDHIAATDAAVAHGLADPNRLGVWGASTGGFSTCWIVGHTTRFRAAVAESAWTNFFTFYYLNDTGGLLVNELGGRPEEIKEIYRSRSPLTYAKHCRTPTLMLHGEDDLRCPIAEAEQFYPSSSRCGMQDRIGAHSRDRCYMGDSDGPLSAREAQNEALLEWFERHL